MQNLIALALAAASPLPAAADETSTETAPASAIPPAVQAVVDNALANGTDAEVQAVLKFVRRTYPAQGPALDGQLAQRAAQRTAELQARLAQAGPFDYWTGRGEIGATRATGNVDNLGLYGSLTLTRAGIAWTHQLRASAQVQETNGIRTQEKLLAAYEPHYKVNDRISAYGLLQAERDPFVGFDARYSASAGLGLALVTEPQLVINIQGGPALRHEELVAGPSENNVSGRAALDARLQLRPGVSLTQAASAFVDSRGNSFTSATGLEAQIVGHLSARLSYNLQYESRPADRLKTTDTQSRVSLVYGF
jgi:putative salt-induced outer membrane protein